MMLVTAVSIADVSVIHAGGSEIGGVPVINMEDDGFETISSIGSFPSDDFVLEEGPGFEVIPTEQELLEQEIGEIEEKQSEIIKALMEISTCEPGLYGDNALDEAWLEKIGKINQEITQMKAKLGSANDQVSDLKHFSLTLLEQEKAKLSLIKGFKGKAAKLDKLSARELEELKLSITDLQASQYKSINRKSDLASKFEHFKEQARLNFEAIQRELDKFIEESVKAEAIEKAKIDERIRFMKELGICEVEEKQRQIIRDLEDFNLRYRDCYYYQSGQNYLWDKNLKKIDQEIAETQAKLDSAEFDQEKQFYQKVMERLQANKVAQESILEMIRKIESDKQDIQAGKKDAFSPDHIMSLNPSELSIAHSFCLTKAFLAFLQNEKAKLDLIKSFGNKAFSPEEISAAEWEELITNLEYFEASQRKSIDRKACLISQIHYVLEQARVNFETKQSELEQSIKESVKVEALEKAKIDATVAIMKELGIYKIEEEQGQIIRDLEELRLCDRDCDWSQTGEYSLWDKNLEKIDQEIAGTQAKLDSAEFDQEKQFYQKVMERLQANKVAQESIVEKARKIILDRYYIEKGEKEALSARHIMSLNPSELSIVHSFCLVKPLEPMTEQERAKLDLIEAFKEKAAKLEEISITELEELKSAIKDYQESQDEFISLISKIKDVIKHVKLNWEGIKAQQNALQKSIEESVKAEEAEKTKIDEEIKRIVNEQKIKAMLRGELTTDDDTVKADMPLPEVWKSIPLVITMGKKQDGTPNYLLNETFKADSCELISGPEPKLRVIYHGPEEMGMKLYFPLAPRPTEAIPESMKDASLKYFGGKQDSKGVKMAVVIRKPEEEMHIDHFHDRVVLAFKERYKQTDRVFEPDSGSGHNRNWLLDIGEHIMAKKPLPSTTQTETIDDANVAMTVRKVKEYMDKFYRNQDTVTITKIGVRTLIFRIAVELHGIKPCRTSLLQYLLSIAVYPREASWDGIGILHDPGARADRRVFEAFMPCRYYEIPDSAARLARAQQYYDKNYVALLTKVLSGESTYATSDFDPMEVLEKMKDDARMAKVSSICEIVNKDKE